MKKNKNIAESHNGHEFVDLGLPSGLLWATCNVGASNPQDYGLYFAWGETVGFTAEQIARGKRKFNNTSYKAKKIKTDLTLEQDAARANLGGNWRMPTKAEFYELIDNCNSTWVTSYLNKGVAGRIFTSKINGNSVFFPAAGDCNGSSVSMQGSYGHYWSASWDSSNFAWGLDFFSEIAFGGDDIKCDGQTVRGVCER